MLFYAGPDEENTFSRLQKHFGFTLNDPPTSEDKTSNLETGRMQTWPFKNTRELANQLFARWGQQIKLTHSHGLK